MAIIPSVVGQKFKILPCTLKAPTSWASHQCNGYKTLFRKILIVRGILLPLSPTLLALLRKNLLDYSKFCERFSSLPLRKTYINGDKYTFKRRRKAKKGLNKSTSSESKKVSSVTFLPAFTQK